MSSRNHGSRRLQWILAVAVTVGLGAPMSASGADAADGTASDTVADGSGGDVSDGGTSDTGGGSGDAGSDTTVGDTSPGDTSVGDTSAGDTSSGDTSVGDTSVGDTSPGDTGVDGDATTDAGDTGVDGGPDVGDTGPDAGEDTGPGMPDTGPDTGVDAGTRVLFAGYVDVQFRSDESGVQVTLRSSDGEARWERTTDRSGRFEFPSIPVGDYQVEVSLSGYATVGESFELEADREVRYSLYRQQEAKLRVTAVFPKGEEPPDGVDFGLTGERGTREPNESIGIQNRRATWTVQTLPVGNWTISAEADGWERVTYQFAVREARENSTPYRIRLFMQKPEGVPPNAETVCVCPDRGGGGRAPGPRGPYGPPATLVLFGLGVLGLRLVDRS